MGGGGLVLGGGDYKPVFYETWYGSWLLVIVIPTACILGYPCIQDLRETRGASATCIEQTNRIPSAVWGFGCSLQTESLNLDELAHLAPVISQVPHESCVSLNLGPSHEYHPFPTFEYTLCKPYPIALYCSLYINAAGSSQVCLLRWPDFSKLSRPLGHIGTTQKIYDA